MTTEIKLGAEHVEMVSVEDDVVDQAVPVDTKAQILIALALTAREHPESFDPNQVAAVRQDIARQGGALKVIAQAGATVATTEA